MKTTITFREGILLGEAWPQTLGWERFDKNGVLCGACILGGLANAIGLKNILGRGWTTSDLMNIYPELKQVVPCPHCQFNTTLRNIISFHLGCTGFKDPPEDIFCTDSRQYTRHETVEWLDSIGITTPPTETVVTEQEVSYAIQ